MKDYVAFWKQGKRLLVGGIVNILLGILFLKVASQCRIPGVITAMGIISLIKGIALVIRGPEKAKAMLDYWANKSPKAMRLFAILAIAIGLLMLRST
ncbi:MAG: hypothetical protein KJ706_10405 [Candidatus Omnitrophica bacterium]|nr:hypothetical protein [Candidatus Omnitrophota bacterium]MBU4413511.1 hypothetical protein [Pseudomonadota bacterium]MBU4590107.1 hypothetical protein [Candidatus Omnitrophota bacterium]